MTVAIKIRNSDHLPPPRRSRASSRRHMNIVVHVPDYCLAGACIEKDKICLPVVVEVSSYWRRGYWRRDLKREVLVRSGSPPPYVGARAYAEGCKSRAAVGRAAR